MNSNKTNVTVYIDRNLVEDLRRAKERTGISKSVLVEQGLRLRLAQYHCRREEEAPVFRRWEAQ
jgi:hypothetical protein